MHATYYDPFNTTKTNYNRNNIKKITRHHMDFFYPRGKECYTCKIQFETEEKKCYIDGKCIWRPHRQYNGSGNGKTGYICVESNYRLKHPDIIYVRRWLPAFLFEHQIDWIFRPNNFNGLCGHHINEVEHDDSPKNISILETTIHSSLHSKLKQQRKKLLNLYQKKEKMTSSDIKQLFKIESLKQEIRNYEKEICQIKKQLCKYSYRYHVILKDVPISISKKEIYQCPVEWTRKYTPPLKSFKRGYRPDVQSNVITY